MLAILPMLLCACIVITVTLDALLREDSTRMLLILALVFGFTGYRIFATDDRGIQLAEVAAERELLRAVREKAPNVYAGIESEIKKKEIKTQQEVLDISINHIAILADRELPAASDDVLRDYYLAAAQRISQLEADKSDRCRQLLLSGISASNLLNSGEGSRTTEMERILSRMLQENDRPRTVSQAQGAQIYRHIREQFARRYSQQLGSIDNPKRAETEEEQRLFCRMTRELLIELGKPENLPALRLLALRMQNR